MKLKLFFPIVAFGLAAGYIVGPLLWPQQSRAERTVEAFKAVCVARHLGSPYSAPKDLGFEESVGQDGKPVWIDGKTAVFLSLEDNRCTLSTYAPHALKKWEAEQTLALLEDFVAKNFPDLPHDPGAQMGSVYKAWTTGDVGSPNRWGVAFFAFPEWGDGAGSILTFYPPQDS